MKPITITEKQELIQRLIDTAYLHCIGRSGGIGYHTKKLKGRDSDILKSLDIKGFLS
jgi:hypothetical protein